MIVEPSSQNFVILNENDEPIYLIMGNVGKKQSATLHFPSNLSELNKLTDSFSEAIDVIRCPTTAAKVQVKESLLRG
ncbi:MAG: hypothetical protein Hyperionvirus11_50 [Hyperionvirus sp.]|uniref:Uncharacterized protein n=1 Tax=Hyperionvirus sp. TaxID=2487770 RepID=A0A3G5A939_9VIRU|nr:MAG: hypothetical protein Hyperionvirus11_50 [Hyperionvirus sp.]